MGSWGHAEQWEGSETTSERSSQASSELSSQFFDVEASEDIHPDDTMKRAVPVVSQPNLHTVHENRTTHDHPRHDVERNSSSTSRNEQRSPRGLRWSRASKVRVQRRANGGCGLLMLLTATIAGVLLGSTFVHYLNRTPRRPGSDLAGGKGGKRTRQPSTIVGVGEITLAPSRSTETPTSTMSLETLYPSVAPTFAPTYTPTDSPSLTRRLPPCPCCTSWHSTVETRPVREGETICFTSAVAVAPRGQCSRAFRSDEHPEWGCHVQGTFACNYAKPPKCEDDIIVMSRANNDDVAPQVGPSV
jgi:hypothetical protein